MSSWGLLLFLAMSLLSPSVRTTQEPGKAFGPPGRQAEICELEVSRAGSQAPRLLPHPTPRSPQILPARCLQQIPSTIFSSNPTTKSPILQDRAGDRRGTYTVLSALALPFPGCQEFSCLSQQTCAICTAGSLGRESNHIWGSDLTSDFPPAAGALTLTFLQT